MRARVQAGGVERGAENLQHLDRALRSVGSDQLDARLQELPLLPPLWAHRAVGVREVTETQAAAPRRRSAFATRRAIGIVMSGRRASTWPCSSNRR